MTKIAGILLEYIDRYFFWPRLCNITRAYYYIPSAK